MSVIPQNLEVMSAQKRVMSITANAEAIDVNVLAPILLSSSSTSSYSSSSTTISGSGGAGNPSTSVKS